jgi:type VI secretion system lysozyme-like protein
MRYNPFLLDKLAEPDPDAGKTLAGGYGFEHSGGMSIEEYKQAVLRDLGQILNTRTFWPSRPLDAAEATPEGATIETEEHVPVFGDFPRVLSSVLCYGLPDTTGLLSYATRPEALARLIQAAIVAFEPRIKPTGLRVTPVASAKQGEAEHARFPNRQRFLVEGDLRLQPRPEPLSFVLEANLLAPSIRVLT